MMTEQEKQLFYELQCARYALSFLRAQFVGLADAFERGPSIEMAHHSDWMRKCVMVSLEKERDGRK